MNLMKRNNKAKSAGHPLGTKMSKSPKSMMKESREQLCSEMERKGQIVDEFNVVSIPKTNESFHLLYDTKGRFRLHSIRDEESKFKLCKVCSVQFGQKGIPYINTYDGRTIRYPDPLIKANDTIKLDLEAQNITDFMTNLSSLRGNVLPRLERTVATSNVGHKKFNLVNRDLWEGFMCSGERLLVLHSLQIMTPILPQKSPFRICNMICLVGPSETQCSPCSHGNNVGVHYATWSTAVLGPVTLEGHNERTTDLTNQIWSYKLLLDVRAWNVLLLGSCLGFIRCCPIISLPCCLYLAWIFILDVPFVEF
ncbi:hypothetical protein RHMOL_Rhmol13G0223200 [Rhododendron molle]|uniref:Uncharacterized protein n=1 Tax=Rhododendron molle TaxID=49168 RepID=A0ACC0L9E7_RHOML|nr:hypothetical protein RHMOL_Rhmol13G0223200 [Rhododendron molle]